MRSLPERPFEPGRLSGASLAFALLAAGLLAIAAPVDAAAARGGGSLAKACKPDISKYCRSSGNSQGELRSCLETHKEKGHVSAKCSKTLEATNGGK